MFDKKSRAIENFDYIGEQEKHEYIQSNLTEKLIRTFLRLSYHINGIEVENYPQELDSSLQLKVEEIQDINNEMLRETFNLASKQNKNQKL